MPSIFYTDLSASYAIQPGGRFELFANVQNLFDKSPPDVSNAASPTATYPTARNLYDVMGQYFTIGAKVRF